MEWPLAEFSWLYRIPLWLSGSLILILFLVSIEIGFASGWRLYRRNETAGKTASSDVSINALLALLGLLLAFTYAFGLSRYDERRHAVIGEVNALGTAFLRADLLPEPGRTELRRRLYDYAKTRLVTFDMINTREKLAQYFDETLEAQQAIWPATRKALTQDLNTPLTVSVMSAINKVLDVHNERLAAAFENIPPEVLILLVMVSAFALGVTGHNSAVQGYRSRWRMIIFAVVLTALIVIIMDFDMPLRGLIQPSTASMGQLLTDMEAALGP